jgi:hypothetical protein
VETDANSKRDITEFETRVLDYIRRFHLVYYDDLYPERKTDTRQIYGIVIAKGVEIETHIYNNNERKLIRELSTNKKYIDNKKRILTSASSNKIFGYLSSEKVEFSPAFKIVDTTVDNKKFNKGGKCIDKNKNEIMKYLSQTNQIRINDHDSKSSICYTYELILRRLDKLHFKSERWFFSPEEYLIINYKL